MASRRTMAELREATTKPCTKQHLFQVGEYQMQDTQLIEPFEVNVALIMNAYFCFARQTGCRPGRCTRGSLSRTGAPLEVMSIDSKAC